MSTRERRQRDIQERERKFLAAARALICRDGLLNLQMAPIAKHCDYAVGTLYQHFESKEDLIVALAGEAAQQKVALFRKVHAWKQASTRERMLGFVVADIESARRYPENYRLMQFALTDVVWGAASPERRRACIEGNVPLGELPESVIAEAVRCGDLDLRGLGISELCFGPWALTLGAQQLLHGEGLIDPQRIADPYRVMLRHAQELLNGLDWKPRVDASDLQALDAFVARIHREVLDENVSL